MIKYSRMNKFIGVDASAVFEQDDTALLFQLSKQDTMLLLGILPVMHWKTRWIGDISQGLIDEFVSRLEYRLMIPIDPNSPTGGYSLATMPIATIFHSMSPNCPENCLPLWQNFTTDISTHPDFVVLSGQVTMLVLREDYPDLYDACPDFQVVVNISGVLTDCVDLSGFQGRFLMGNNPDNLTNDIGDGDITTKSVSPSLRRNGAEIHILTDAQIANHRHAPSTGAVFMVNTFPNPGGYVTPAPGTGNVSMDGGFTAYTGGGQSHNNQPPYITTYRYVVAKPANDLFDGVVTDENICDYIDGCLPEQPEENDPQWEDYNPNDNPTIETLDCVFGGLQRMVDWLNGELNNYLDIIDELGDLASVVPTFSLIGSLVQFAGVMSAAVTTLVRLGNTQDLRDEIACWFFCRIKSRGEPYQLLPDDILAFRTYSWEVVNDSICAGTPLTLFCPDVLLDILGDNRRSAYMAYYYMFSMYPYRNYILRFSLGYTDECNDDWELLCDCGGQETITIDAGDPSGTNAINVFEDGITYRLIVSGTWKRASGSRVNDAVWASTDNWNTVIDTELGIAVDGIALPEQPYSATHVYVWEIVGDGSIPNFKIIDNGTYSDNSGQVTIDVIRLS